MRRTASRNQQPTSFFRPNLQARVPGYIASALTVPRATMTGEKAVEQMADDLRVTETRSGSVTREDLEVLGWSGLQIDRHISAARKTAQSLSVRA